MNEIKEIRYNLYKSTWDDVDFKKVFGIDPESKVDIEIDGKMYKKCGLSFDWYGAGFFIIKALLKPIVYDDGSKGYKDITIHDEMSYKYQPFSSYDMEKHKVKIYYQDHIYERREVSNDKCDKCGRGSIEFGFFMDGKEVIISKFIEDSIAVK